MKSNLSYIVLLATLALVALTSCQKEDDSDAVSTTFIKVHDSESELIARGAIELPNGDLILLGCSYELPAQSAVFGQQRSEVACYSSQGDLKWSKQVPSEVHALWAGEVLNNGNIILAGFDSIQNSINIGLVEMSPDGTVLNTNTFYNNIGQDTGGQFVNNGTDKNRLALHVLSNGLILLSVATETPPSFAWDALRLILCNENLDIIQSRSFDQIGNGISTLFPFQVDELESGNIMVNPTAFSTTLMADTVIFRFYELQIPDLSTVSNTVFELLIGNQDYNTFIHSSSGLFLTQSYGENPQEYQMRNMETYYSDERPSILQISDEGTEVRQFTELPRNGYFSQLEHTDDGGFIAMGNANLNQDITSSQSRIILGKFSRTGAVEWLRTINAGMPLFGHSIRPNSNGYLLSASNYDTDNKFQTILIQLNQTGTF